MSKRAHGLKMREEGEGREGKKRRRE